MDAYLPAFSRMSADLGVSASTTQLTLTMFLVGVALGQLSIGVLSDRFGRRPLLLWGSVLAFVAGAGAALAPGVGLLLVARFFQGLGGATAAYTAVFAACGLTVTLVVAACGSLAGRISPERQVRMGIIAVLAIDVVFAVVCAGALDGPVGADSRALLTAITVSLFIAHVVGLGTCIGNLPAIALGRTGRWAGTGSALLGFVQFVFGGLASPLVGLSGATSGVAFGIVIVVLGAVANALAVFGLRDRGERERVKAERAAARSRRLGRDQL